MSKTMLAKEIARRHPITEKDAQNLLDGIDSGKLGGFEARYIVNLEARDKLVDHLTDVLNARGMRAFDTDGEPITSKEEIIYIVFLVDEYKQAQSINSVFRDLTTDVFKAQAFSKGQQMVGLQHNGRRPTIVVNTIQEDLIGGSLRNFLKWYDNCVIPSAVRAKLIEI